MLDQRLVGLGALALQIRELQWVVTSEASNIGFFVIAASIPIRLQHGVCDCVAASIPKITRIHAGALRRSSMRSISNFPLDIWFGHVGWFDSFLVSHHYPVDA